MVIQQQPKLGEEHQSSLLLLLLKEVGNARLGEQLTPYQSEDPNPTTPTHRKKEEKGKTVGDKKLASS